MAACTPYPYLQLCPYIYSDVHSLLQLLSLLHWRVFMTNEFTRVLAFKHDLPSWHQGHYEVARARSPWTE